MKKLRTCQMKKGGTLGLVHLITKSSRDLLPCHETHPGWKGKERGGGLTFIKGSNNTEGLQLNDSFSSKFKPESLYWFNLFLHLLNKHCQLCWWCLTRPHSPSHHQLIWFYFLCRGNSQPTARSLKMESSFGLRQLPGQIYFFSPNKDDPENFYLDFI